MKNNIQYLKEEAKIYEREILSLLLDVSKSFSDESFTKERRNEIFVKIDDLRDKVKDINKVISDLQNSEENIEEVSVEKKVDIEPFVKIEEKDMSDSSIEEKSEEIEEENIDADLNDNIENVEEIITIKKEEVIDIEVAKNDSDNEIELENYSMRRRNRRRKTRRNVPRLNDNQNISEEFEYEEIVNENNNTSDDNDLTQDIEEIDRLIEEAQNLNNDIIKFPDHRRKSVENIELDQLDEEKEVKDEEVKIEEDVVEPVPVLFGNSRAQNQMVIRKKSNGFSDKLKSLIFKIKTMLGGENEE